MAKEQGLLLNPDKITGTCGRLLCCLRYEHHWYCEAFANLPEQGSRVKVKKDGQVKEVRIVTRNAVLRTAYVSDDEGNMFWVDFEEINTTWGMTPKGQ
jgi:cell fate regulator YaaT (PSP1 superfamily)